MARKLIPRLAGAAALVAALVAALTLVAGTGSAQTSAAQENYAPKNTGTPTIKGTAQVGQTVAAQPGSWIAESSPTFTYLWYRCNDKGTECKPISDARKQEYKVQSDDSGNTLRVVVTATTKSGSASATSPQTSVVPKSSSGGGGSIQGAIKLQNGKTSIPASTVALPQRLIVDGIRFTPNPLTDRTAFVGQFHVSDTRGYVVRDALVKVTGLPYSWAHSRTEVRTGQDGWASVTIIPTRNMPLNRRAALVMFVRARVEGQSLLAGASARRLVQVRIR